jgi:3-phosphoshikimate 1-carboxyvinyltransferase
MRVEGDVRVPGDKSLTHRALMFSAVARGRSHLFALLTGEDCQSTARVLSQLGAAVPSLPVGGEVTVDGRGLESWHAPEATLDCGNSGTTARLLMGLLAGRPFTSRLTGDASLRSRPMRRVTEPLTRMGVVVHELERADRLPLELTGGSLTPLAHRSPHASAQIKSAILLAGLSGGVEVSVLEPYRSRDHTERMLSSLGVKVTSGSVADGWLVRLTPPSGPLAPLEMRVPGDPSSAAFILALGLLADAGELRVRDVCLNPTRTGFIGALRRMGGRIEVAKEREEGGEPVGDLLAAPSRLRGTTICAEEVPSLIDEIPVLAALATRAEGETRITGAAELRAKESDRITVMVRNLRTLGAHVEELPDGMVVQGSDAPLAGRVQAHHDHRIAMAFGVLAAHPANRITIDQPQIVDVSFPGFWRLLNSLAGRTGHSTP